MTFNVNDFANSLYALMNRGQYDEANQIILERLKEMEAEKEDCYI